jgi:hypothetical protein
MPKTTGTYQRVGKGLFQVFRVKRKCREQAFNYVHIINMIYISNCFKFDASDLLKRTLG